MRQFKVLKLLRFWRTREDDAQNKETAPLIPKENIDTQAAVFDSTNGEEVHDGKAWQDEPVSGQGGWAPSWSCDSVLKSLLFLSNLLFCVVGLVALALGVWGLVEKESLAQERVGQLGADPMLLVLCLGLALALLCLCGCVGTLRENACLLRAFSAALLALLTSQVLLAIAVYALHGQVGAYLRSAMLLAMARYQDDLDLRFLTDELQMGLQCCGADSYRDWEINMYFNCSGPGVQACGVPPSCCVDPLENGTVWNSQCGVGAQRLDEFSAQAVVFLGGCLGGVSRWVERNSGSIGVAGVVLLGVQVLGVFISTRLLEHIQRSKSQY
ncbi:tetraspanin-10 [Anguilla anguilla]|uniref:tetraspanin-10 n=1 Tax=Anguilla anguilla TaxID=7936 RepID=UPI0015AA31AD|nr:tetraspanin-10 [Anguilla anguilla]XP_035259564.1 tetraspanin-10 [Anguilla anguilla]